MSKAEGNQTEETRVYPKLKPALKKRWLQALRGGHYKQCRRMLHGSRGGFCCMGVALDLIDHKGWAKEATYVNDDVSQRGFDWKTLESGGVDDDLGRFLGIPGRVCRELAEFNDENKRSFRWIADWIEKNL